MIKVKATYSISHGQVNDRLGKDVKGDAVKMKHRLLILRQLISILWVL